MLFKLIKKIIRCEILYMLKRFKIISYGLKEKEMLK